MDISKAMLQYVPSGIESCAASMTELPFRSGSFDAAYATESLEHAVDIETAVAEICRVVRPDGRHRRHRQERQEMGASEDAPSGSNGSDGRSSSGCCDGTVVR